MWNSEKKRKPEKMDSLIGRQTVVQGDLRFQGGLHVDGTVRGNIYAEEDEQATLSLSEHAEVEGEVSVPFISIDGTIKGDVHSSEHIELSAHARVIGNVHYNLIEMALGAQVNGKLLRRSSDMETEAMMSGDLLKEEKPSLAPGKS